MFNLKKKDAVADAVAMVLAQEAELSDKQKKIAKIAGDKEKIDAADLAALRAGKKPVEEGFDDMEKYLKDKNKPQPSGGAGKKQGSKYGGSKQKEEEPKDDMKEDVEQIDELKTSTLLRYSTKANQSLIGGDRNKEEKRVQGINRAVGKIKTRYAKEDVDSVDEAYTSKEIKMATGIAKDKRYAGGNMTGAAKVMDKIKPGLSQTTAAQKSLRQANEDVESVDEKAPPGFEGTVKAMKKHKDIDNPFALAWSMKNKGYKSHKKADGSMKKEEVEELEEAVSRKHFQQVADLIKTHDDAGKRKELAQHHAEIFKQQNPRFDHAKFMKAAGVNEDVEHVEEDINKDRTKDMISGRKPTKQTDDVGPGSDGKSTKAKLSAESWLKNLKKK
jgi:hypothetical protein